MAIFLLTIQVNFGADSQTTTATSGPPPLISPLFHAAFFAWATPFLQFGCFCVDIINM